MENLNGVHPQDGNQINIGKNAGTIHVHNHSKDNVEVMTKLLEQEKIRNEQMREIGNFLKESTKTVLDMAQKSMKTKKKK